MSESSVFQAQTLYTWYEVDWDKVQTIEDMKLLLKAIDMKLTIKNRYFDEIQHLLVKSE